jgi:hypothetical protein
MKKLCIFISLILCIPFVLSLEYNNPNLPHLQSSTSCSCLGGNGTGISSILSGDIYTYITGSNTVNINISSFDGRYSNGTSSSSSNSTFNVTYDYTSKDVSANRSAWFSTYNISYDIFGNYIPICDVRNATGGNILNSIMYLYGNCNPNTLYTSFLTKSYTRTSSDIINLSSGSDCKYLYYGYLNITSNAEFNVNNCNLIFNNSATDGESGILVHGGKLTLNYTNLTEINHYSQCRIFERSTLRINNSYIAGCGADTNALNTGLSINTSNVQINNLTILRGYSSSIELRSNNLVLYNVNFDNSSSCAQYPLKIYDQNNITLINSQFYNYSSGACNSMYLSNAKLTLINSTYKTAGGVGSDSSIFFRKYVPINTIDTSSYPLGNSIVDGLTNNGTLDDSQITDINGNAQLTLTEYKANVTGKYYLTPHNLTVSKAGYGQNNTVWINISLDTNMTVTIPSTATTSSVETEFRGNFTNMNTDCSAGNYSYGVLNNGTLKCRSDLQGSSSSLPANVGFTNQTNTWTGNQSFLDNVTILGRLGIGQSSNSVTLHVNGSGEMDTLNVTKNITTNLFMCSTIFATNITPPTSATGNIGNSSNRFLGGNFSGALQAGTLLSSGTIADSKGALPASNTLLTTTGAQTITGTDIFGGLNSTGNITAKDYIVGKNLRIMNTTNSGMDRCTMASGVCTIANTRVTNNTNIFCQIQQSAGTLGSMLYISSRNVNINYTITDLGGTLDTSIVGCLLIEPY